jgi:hypothetical protein
MFRFLVEEDCAKWLLSREKIGIGFYVFYIIKHAIKTEKASLQS